MRDGVDPYVVLGVPRGADEATIHAAYRAAVRRTHPDAGGTSADFESVQEAYEELRDPVRRARWEAQPTQAPRPRAAPAAASHHPSMDELLAESQRLEDEARRLAGMATRHGGGGEPDDSVGAVLRDAGAQLRDVADEGVRELRRFIRKRL
jgi:curved DNA-binding protein CbpA